MNRNKRIINIIYHSFHDLLLENFSDVLEIVVGQSDVDHVFFQHGAILHGFEKIGVFRSQVSFSALQLVVFLSENFVLVFEVFNDFLQTFFDSGRFLISQTAVSILHFSELIFLNIQERNMLESGLLSSFSSHFHFSSQSTNFIVQFLNLPFQIGDLNTFFL